MAVKNEATSTSKGPTPRSMDMTPSQAVEEYVRRHQQYPTYQQLQCGNGGISYGNMMLTTSGTSSGTYTNCSSLVDQLRQGGNGSAQRT